MKRFWFDPPNVDRTGNLTWRWRCLGTHVRSLYYRSKGLCGNRDGGYGACNKVAGHQLPYRPDKFYLLSWHAEYRKSKLWAEWSGS